jgi:hypothetical protein
MDFTIRTYKQLLEALNNSSYAFQPFAEFIENPAEKAIVLRHDVDAKKLNSLLFAKIQAEAGIKGTYYFRVVSQSYDEAIIREIAAMGHEIGYHYETMDTCRGDIDMAYDKFCRNLELFRKFVPVKTICMHGSPMSKYDNRAIWQKYNYRKLGLIGEPYFDINFREVFYLTDTGRRWDGEGVSIRDKVKKEQGTRNKNDEYRISTQHPTTCPELVEGPNTQHLSFHTTNDIIHAAHNDQLPDKILMTFHPQRWTDQPLPWIKELIWQNVKNQIKKFMVKQ